MSPAAQVMLSGTLTFGVPLLLALHELSTLRRKDGGEGGPRVPEPDDPLPPLPPCLLVPPRPYGPARDTTRPLELA